MRLLTLQISLVHPHQRLWRNPPPEVEELVGSHRLYRKGTNQEWYLDFQERPEADLVLVNLNLLPGVEAHYLLCL